MTDPIVLYTCHLLSEELAKRFTQFPWMRYEDVIKFYGGPLHGKIAKTNWLEEYKHFQMFKIEPFLCHFQIDQMPSEVEVKIVYGRYRRMRESIIVLNPGYANQFCYVFEGMG